MIAKAKQLKVILGAVIVLIWAPMSVNAIDIDLNYQFSNFYKEKNYELAPEILSTFLTQIPKIDQNYYWPTAFYFSRVFNSDTAYTRLQQIYSGASKVHKAYILDILYLNSYSLSKAVLAAILKTETDTELKSKAQAILDHEDFTYDPLLEEITNSNQLDMLWTAFLTSGDLAPVDKIAAVLDWPDLVRQKLANFSGSSADRSKAAELLGKFGIELEGGLVSDLGDTDIFISLSLQDGKLMPEFRQLRQILKISDQEFYTMIIKGSAFWSLSSNAQQHELVFEECKKLAADSRTPGNTMMRILLASRSPKNE